MGLPLWRENGPVFCVCCWPLPAQSFSGPSPLGLATIFYSLRFETFLFVASYDSQGNGGSIRPRRHTGWAPIIVGFALYGLGSDHSTENTRCLAVDIWESHRKHLLQHWFYCCVRVLRELPRNGSALLVEYLLRACLPRRSRAVGLYIAILMSGWDM
jgi:hypothetical protein